MFREPSRKTRYARKALAILVSLAMVISFTPVAFADEEAPAVEEDPQLVAEEDSSVDEAVDDTASQHPDGQGSTESELGVEAEEPEPDSTEGVLPEDEVSSVDQENEETAADVIEIDGTDEADTPIDVEGEEEDEDSDGDDDAEKLSVPAALIGDGTKAVQAVNGEGHFAVLLDDGTVWMWGANNFGQCAQPVCDAIDEPTKVMDGVVAIASGANHMVALKSDGTVCTVWTWGANDQGQLGDGTFESRFDPTQVAENAVAVFAGNSATIVQKSDASYDGWGFGVADDPDDSSVTAFVSDLSDSILWIDDAGTVWMNGPTEVVRVFSAGSWMVTESTGIENSEADADASEDVNDATVNLEEQASSSKTLSFDQGAINALGKQGRDAKCMAYCYAYAASMCLGKSNSGDYYWNGSGAVDRWGQFERQRNHSTQGVLKRAYDAINDNKPCILYVTQRFSSGSYQHWVLIVGYQNVSNPNNLSLSNFLMLDPYRGSSSYPVNASNNGQILRFEGDNIRVSKVRVRQVPPPTPTCQQPTIIPRDVLGGKIIEIRNNESGATMRYTTDGYTDPTNTRGTVYSGTIVDPWEIMGVRAIAYKNGAYNSKVTYYTVRNGATQAPTFSTSYAASGVKVEIASATKGSTIVYTTDGTNPTFDVGSQRITNGTRYTGAITLTSNATVRAMALSSGNMASSVSSTAVQVLPPEDPGIWAVSANVAAGDVATARWDKVATASSYIAVLYRDDVAVETQTITACEASFVLPEAGVYSIGVKAKNIAGESEESNRVSVEAMAPCKVRFMANYTDEDGTEVSIPVNEQMVKWGTSAVKPATQPQRKGYNFDGWNRSLDRITEDTDIVAQWEIKKYVVQFYSADGKTRISRQVVDYNSAAVEPDPGEAPVGYVFSGWTVSNADDDSARNFKKVDSNMTLRAVWAWGDEELPVVAQITRAERTASGNYTVVVRLTNHPEGITTALLRVALKTSNDKLVQTSRETVEIDTDGTIEKSVTLKYSGDYVATVAEVEVVGLDGNYRTGGAFSKVVTAPVTSFDNFSYTNWTEWSTEMPEASDTVEVEEAVQYRYRDKQTTTSTSTSMDGWTRDGTSNTTYGSWVTQPTTTSKPNTSDTLQITNTTTRYNYYHWCSYYDNVWNHDSCWVNNSSVKHTTSTSYDLPKANKSWGDKGGRAYDMRGPYSSCAHHTSGHTYWWPESTVNTYTYQTRSKTVTYGYYKWGDWSEFSFDEATASNSREVESRTVYRSRTKVPNAINGNEDETGTKQTITGVLDTGTDLAGKEATIMVYNVTNTDPNEDQIQYIGQTVIGEGNTYSFEFIPRYDPTVESGDFIVSLGVKGATGLVNVSTIKAPRAQYKVTYQYEKPDGTVEVLSEQTVNEGESAQMPEAPTREGSMFLGWSSSATRINSDLVINALFAPRTCVVAWVDYTGQDAYLETYEYGAPLVAPAQDPVQTGYIFKGWDKATDGTYEVTDNMIVTAVYEPEQYTVMFANANGSVFKTVKAYYGEAAELPAEHPTVEGMEFVGWDTSGGTPWWYVTEDMIVKPLFAYGNTVSSPFATVELAEGYVSAQGAKVYLDTSTEGAEIRYTTDGSEPTAESPLYNEEEGVTVTEPILLRAMACASEMNDSSITDIPINVTATNDVSNAEAGISEAPFFYGDPAEPGVMVWLGEDLLAEGVDYTVEYSNNTTVGVGTATITGIGDYTGTKTIDFDILEAPEDEGDAIDITNDENVEIAIAPDKLYYDGTLQTPEVTVKYGNALLHEGEDYDLLFVNNKKVGTAVANVVGKGNFTGIAASTFQIYWNTINKNAGEGGKVTIYDTVNPDGSITTASLHAKPGTTVTYRTEPEYGFTLLRFNITYKDPATGANIIESVATGGVQRIAGTGKPGTKSTYTFVMPDADVTINAEFGPDRRTITKALTGNGSGNLMLVGSDGLRTSQTADATPPTLHPQVGQKVYFRSVPEKGSKLTKFNVTWTDENGVETKLVTGNGITKMSDDLYCFTMPNYNVSLNGEFSKR